MTFLEETYFGNTLQAWLAAAGTAFACFFVIKIGQRIFVRRFSSLAEKSDTRVGGLIVEVLKRTRGFFLVTFALYVGSYVLTLSSAQQRFVNTAIVVALLVQGAIWGNAVVSFWLGGVIQRRKTGDAEAATSLSAVTFVAKLVLWSVTVLLVLENLGVDVTALVAGLGVGGIAVALALQNVLGDLFASLSIVLDKPFVIGDFVIVDQYMGTVEHVGLKTTRVRSLSGEQVIFSNADLLRSRIRNFKRMFERRVEFRLGVTYQTPQEKLAMISSILREIVQSKAKTRFDRAHFKEFGDSGLVYEVVYYVLDPDYNVYMDTQQAINLEIAKHFAEESIEFAYPTRTVYVHPLEGDLQGRTASGTERAPSTR